jgi:hypothetical protein
MKIFRFSLEGVVVSFLTVLAAQLALSGPARWVVPGDPVENPAALEAILALNPLFMLLVFWEDLVFVLPTLLVPEKLRVPALIVSAAVFSSLHGFWGPEAMIMKLPIIPLWHVLARKYGLLSTMASHVLTDLLIVVTIQTLVALNPELLK